MKVCERERELVGCRRQHTHRNVQERDRESWLVVEDNKPIGMYKRERERVRESWFVVEDKTPKECVKETERVGKL